MGLTSTHSMLNVLASCLPRAATYLDIVQGGAKGGVLVQEATNEVCGCRVEPRRERHWLRLRAHPGGDTNNSWEGGQRRW